MAINYSSKEDMGYLFIALRECCDVGAKTMFKVKDIHSAGSYAGIEILASDTNGVIKPSELTNSCNCISLYKEAE